MSKLPCENCLVLPICRSKTKSWSAKSWADMITLLYEVLNCSLIVDLSISDENKDSCKIDVKISNFLYGKEVYHISNNRRFYYRNDKDEQ